MDITTLCGESHTDKHRGEFPHSELYDVLFLSFRDKPICLLEIGVNRGGSIPVWEQYFPNAKLLATDINPRCLLYTTDRTTIDLVDQTDVDAMTEHAEDCGPFNIVIDDGSHQSADQILTFETLWPYVLPGGIFVVEDTETSYREDYTRGGGPTCVDYFKGCIDDIHKSVADRLVVCRDINTIIIKQDMIVITKRDDSALLQRKITSTASNYQQAKRDLSFRESLSLAKRDSTWSLQWVKRDSHGE